MSIDILYKLEVLIHVRIRDVVTDIFLDDVWPSLIVAYRTDQGKYVSLFVFAKKVGDMTIFHVKAPRFLEQESGPVSPEDNQPFPKSSRKNEFMRRYFSIDGLIECIKKSIYEH